MVSAAARTWKAARSTGPPARWRPCCGGRRFRRRLRLLLLLLLLLLLQSPPPLTCYHYSPNDNSWGAALSVRWRQPGLAGRAVVLPAGASILLMSARAHHQYPSSPHVRAFSGAVDNPPCVNPPHPSILVPPCPPQCPRRRSSGCASCWTRASRSTCGRSGSGSAARAARRRPSRSSPSG